MHKFKKSIGEKIFETSVKVILVILTLCFLYPIIYTLSLSLSDTEVLGYDNIKLLPAGFSLESYKFVLSSSGILRYYSNSIYYAVSGTLITLLLTSMVAYPLSERKYSGKKFITIYLLITMFFSGGMIASYLLMIKFHLIDTLWVMILPGVTAWNVMIYKTFFSHLPFSLRESAHIDGASHFRILFSIILPLSKALLATMALFALVGHWNGYFNALIYLRDVNRHPIQMLLRKLLVTLDYQEMEELASLGDIDQYVKPRTVKSATVIITITPIMCVYPFMQKYFVKGMLVGSVKG